LRKIYALIFLHLLVATILAYLAWTHHGFESWLLTNWGFSFVCCLIVTLLLILLTFFLKSTVLSKIPVNIIVYLLFTIAFAFLFAYFEAKSWDGEIYVGLFVFTAVTFSLLIHSIISKCELTFQSATLYVFGAVLLAILIFEIFTHFALHLLYIIGALAIIWGFYLVWENESVISGAKTEWSREDPISGAVSVYMNIFALFLHFTNLIR
jgi:FtsH-binding integral membrane protein